MGICKDNAPSYILRLEEFGCSLDPRRYRISSYNQFAFSSSIYEICSWKRWPSIVVPGAGQMSVRKVIIKGQSTMHDVRSSLWTSYESFDNVHSSFVNAQENWRVPGHRQICSQHSQLHAAYALISVPSSIRSRSRTSFAIASDLLGISEFASILASAL